MRILVDENIPRMTVNSLRAAGHDVLDFRGTREEGTSDEGVALKACAEGRLLISTDKGFAQLRGARHPGVLIVLLKRPNRRKIRDRIIMSLVRFQPNEWPGLVVVVRDTVQSVWHAHGSADS